MIRDADADRRTARQHLARKDPARAHHGLEHFGFDSENLEADIKRLEGLGARLLEGPIEIPGGPRICFIQAPDDVRVELIQRSKTAIAGGCC